MSALDDLLVAAESVRATKPTYPDSWQPGVQWDGSYGTITGASANRSPDWSALLRYWDFDPDEYEIIEPVQVRTWDAAIGNGEVRRMWYHRANLRRKRQGAADIGELLKLVRRARVDRPAVRTPVSKTGNDGSSPSRHRQPAYLLAINDLQIGKRGTAPTITRICEAIDKSVERARKIKPASIWLPALGDLGEACDGQYPMQTFEVELDRRDQGRIVRRLLLYAIDQHRKVAPVVMPAVAGNHGEHRKDGKAFTSFGDNDDLAWPEEVAEACATNPAYSNVRFLIPREDLTLTVQPVPDGPIVGLVHGHQFPKGAQASQVAEQWWKGQMYGQRPVGDATILISAHRHHFAISQNGSRSWIQAPTPDSGSRWFAETVGPETAPGMLSLVVTKTGWDDLKLL